MKRCPVCDTAYPSHKTNCDEHHVLLIDSQELEPGTIVRNKFEIVRTLGEGGMGIVYQARNILDGRMRALKFLSNAVGQQPRLLARFRQEAQIELVHPNIVRIYDTEQAENGSLYIVMEFVEGHSLASELENGPLPVERALDIARGITEGLAAAHAEGIIHRDVKPGNILLSKGQTPKLLDFGIAAINESSVRITTTRGMLGTPDYASPEQCKGMPGALLDGRVDLYSLGCVLYHMLTGQPPFHTHPLDVLAVAHLTAERVPPSRLRPEVAAWPGLDALVLRLLESDRDRRPADTAETLAALDAIRRRQPHDAAPIAVTTRVTVPDRDNALQKEIGKTDGSNAARYSASAGWTDYGDGTEYPSDPPAAALAVSSGPRKVEIRPSGPPPPQVIKGPSVTSSSRSTSRPWGMFFGASTFCGLGLAFVITQYASGGMDSDKMVVDMSAHMGLFMIIFLVVTVGGVIACAIFER